MRSYLFKFVSALNFVFWKVVVFELLPGTSENLLRAMATLVIKNSPAIRWPSDVTVFGWDADVFGNKIIFFHYNL
jgi:hypothetical protein